ncbi:DNA-binding SARP family transcriptional activator [Actinoplanes lutulentus]|uniref:Transcriptional regulator n=1 Tax=Actinoplanes lutulentus TaxID=1287878 RepID=A0A327YYJ5_9ACTN|nr:BTAD domain-containing putative transcriptional regulator [Actinoplanes lutulentus]MBB2946591.1 DNA-binding SARP family transcriptional activator [Actinoplanes lutulentus]RAK26509.1 transcriptional regulator [Actinoplanes lutulentus]
MTTPATPEHADGDAASGDGLRLHVLGPLRVLRGDVTLDLGPPQQTFLLAVLLARVGRPVSVSELIDLMWGDDAPASAVNVIQKHIGALRRLLEPAAAPRGASSYLRRYGNGYVFVDDHGVLDLVMFRRLVAAAERASGDPALDAYVRALRLWRGPAGGGIGGAPAVKPIFTALDEEFFAACIAAADLAVALGTPQRVLRPLGLAASLAPLNEPVQAALIVALGASDRQAEALALAGRVRARLADELGIDAGPALRAAHQQVLGRPGPATVEPAVDALTGTDGLVGRVAELAVLRSGIESAIGYGTGVVIVEGEPGAGKTRLLEEAAAEAGRRDALVVWGHCMEGDGTPSMWPWIEAVGAILAALPEAHRRDQPTGELDRLLALGEAARETLAAPGGGARFRLFEQVADLVARAAAQRRLLLIIDDLHWADVASLHLFGHLAARLPAGAALVGALRTHAPVPSPDLTRVLATASRASGHRRIRLGPLSHGEVSELVRRETGRRPAPAVARGIHARTAGNPFFVRELSRLLGAGGTELADEATTRPGVPSTVRDVVQDRIAGLGDQARRLLQIAALFGREADVELLARTAGTGVQAALDHLEPVEALGLLGPAPDNPFAVRFAHDLVRESIVVSTPQHLVPRLHLHIADALDAADPGGESAAERLAHHLWAAGPLADPARTVTALIHAARQATGKSAFEAAEQQLRTAVRVAREARLAEFELAALSQLTLVLGMLEGYVGSPPEILERAETLARELGREREATSFLFTRFTGLSEGAEVERSGPLAQRLRKQGEASGDPVVRVYGLLAWGMHQWESGDIGEASRHLTWCTEAAAEDRVLTEDLPLLRDVKLLAAGMLALMTTLHGDVARSRELFDTMEAEAGDDRYAVTFWASFAVIAAGLAEDPHWALRIAERSIAVDPDLSFVFLGTYARLGRCWGLGMTGQDPSASAASAAELDRLVSGNLLDPPRSSYTTWLALLAGLYLTAGDTEAAGAALDRAEHGMRTHGERHCEGLLLLTRARLLLARGEPAGVVRAAAERARALSAGREAHLFARQAERLLSELGD